jgi:RNA polymerase sigma-70 factor (ECF subfamily)
MSNMEAKILTTELHDLEAGLTTYVHSLNLGNKEQSLVQETFMKAIMRYPKSNMNGYLKSWTGIIKRKAFINNYRNIIKQKPAKGLDDMFMIYRSESDYESDYKEIVQNIDHLDESLRKPFRMFVEGCTYAEIADATMLNIETVKTRILIARSQLMLQNR